MTVVSNTSPLRYLIAVGRPHLIEQIFHHVLIPHMVERELADPSAPQEVRQWMANRPAWLEVRGPRSPDPELARQLDRGEAEAIQLAIDTRADFLLIDELRGRTMAISRGLVVIGILGILLESYRRQHVHNRWKFWPIFSPVDFASPGGWSSNLKNRSVGSARPMRHNSL